MADQNLDLALRIKATADDTASPTVAELQAKIQQLTAELKQQQETVPATAKDWADYAAQLAGIASASATAGDQIVQMRIHLLELSVATAVITQWRTLVEGVQGAYGALNNALLNVADYGLAAVDAGLEGTQSGWSATQLQVERLGAKVGELTANFIDLGKIAGAMELAGVALAIAEIGVKAQDSNQQTRALIEQVGDLSSSLQTLDPGSAAVVTAKERFEELYQASLNLHTPIEELLPVYQAFFDQVKDSSISIKDAGTALTDFLNVQKSLGASAGETAAAQKEVTAAFNSGTTSTQQLSNIFGAALNPALDAVASQMGITHAQLETLINTGQRGTASVFPALAAAARSVTAPLTSTGAAAEFSKKQFEAMGLSFYDLSASKLPGVTTALKYTSVQIAATADSAVDPIGAAVEQIVNLGVKVEDWAIKVKQNIIDAFAGPDVKQALSTGLQEAIYALDLILVGAREAITATAQSIGTLAGAATTATNPLSALNDIWLTSAEKVSNSRDRLQGYINSLEGFDNAAGRTAEQAKALNEALLPNVKLTSELQEVIDKLTDTRKVSEQVTAVWKAMGDLDFTGENIKDLLVLRQTINAVGEQTKNTIATEEAFAKILTQLPTTQLDALVAKVTELQPALKAAGDEGTLSAAVMAAAFLQTVDAGSKAATAAGLLAKSLEGILSLDVARAKSAQDVTDALTKQSIAMESVADKTAAEAKVAQAAATTAVTEAEAQQALAVSKNAQADASQAVYDKLQKELEGVEVLTDEETKGLEAAKADAAQKAITAAQADVLTQKLQLEAAQLTGVAQAHQLATQGATALVNALGDLKTAYDDASKKVEILKIEQEAGIVTQQKVDSAVAEQIRTLAEYNTAVDLTKKQFQLLGLDAEQVLTGMDAKFKDTIKTLQDLASSGTLTGAALTQAFQNAIKTASSQEELKALDTLIKSLGTDGKVTGQEMTIALDAVKDKLQQVKESTDPVAQAFKSLGVQSHDSLNLAAQDAKDAFTTIQTSGTATVGDLNTAFEAMAKKVMAAGEASGPVGTAMAAAFLKAKAATDEEIAEVNKLIAEYEKVGTAATESATQQTAATEKITTTTKQQTTGFDTLAGSQKQVITNYDDLSDAGKTWSQSLLTQAANQDNATAGMLTYSNETGKVITQVDNLITREKSVATQIDDLNTQFNDGTISSSSLSFQLSQLAYQLTDPMTTAGKSALATLKDLQSQIKSTKDTISTTSIDLTSTSNTAALVDDLRTISSLLDEINSKAKTVGTNIANQVTQSSVLVQQVVKELKLQAGRAN